MKANFRMASLLAAAMCLASCGGTNTSQYADAPAGAPNGLSYPDPNLFTQGVTIPTLVPTVTGSPTNYLVTPDLPGGLKLNADGTISGTPSEPRATATYYVTAGNSVGTSTFGVRITVHGRFTVGGVVNGLTGIGLVLTNNGADNLAVSANGQFTFSDVYPVGTIYAVAVATQPAGQNCSVAGGSGYLTNVNYGGVVVTCGAVTNKAAQFGSRVLNLTCLDDPSPDSIQGFVTDQKTGLVTLLGEVIHQFPSDAALPGQIKCGTHAVSTDETWIYVRNADTNIVSVYAAGLGPIDRTVVTALPRADDRQ